MAKKAFNYKTWTILIIILGIIIRFVLASVYTVAGDACWQLSASRFIAENKRFPLFEPLGRDEPFWPPPLFHIIAAFLYSVFSIFGANAAEFGMKMLSPALGSLTLIFVYLINKMLFSHKIAFYSMLFTTFIPMFMDYNIFSYIDGIITFFAVLSIYFALDGRYIKSSIAAGLAALTKYNGIFVVPLLIYIAYKNTKNRALLLKKILFIIIIPAIIATPWFVRNYINFGNPFWPFMNFIFKGLETSAFESGDLQAFNFANIFSINSIIFTYLAIFGVPDGDYTNIFFFDIPNIRVLFAVWILSTLFFLLPLAKSGSIKDKTKRNILLVWSLSYAVVVLLYIGNVGWSAGRFFMPAIPALGMFYGNGIVNISFKNKMLKRVFYILVFAAILGFIAAESAKITLASKEWGKYKEDFIWIRENSRKDDLILPGAHCLSYYTNRGTLKFTLGNLKKADYIWINEDFILERRSIASKDLLKEVDSNKYYKAYENKKTGTIIYQVKQ